MGKNTLVTMSADQFKKYIDEAYERGKAKGRAEALEEMKCGKKTHKTVKLDGDEEYKANIVEE